MDVNLPLLLFSLTLMAAAMLFLLAVLVFIGRPWIRAVASGAPISVFSVLGMRLRGSPVNLLMDAYITLCRAGISIPFRNVEGIYIDNRRRVRTSDDLVDLVKANVAKA